MDAFWCDEIGQLGELPAPTVERVCGPLEAARRNLHYARARRRYRLMHPIVAVADLTP